MAVIEQEPMLTKVKASLGITGSFHDETLKIYLYEVLCFLDDAGVSEAILKGEVWQIFGTMGMAGPASVIIS